MDIEYADLGESESVELEEAVAAGPCEGERGKSCQNTQDEAWSGTKLV